MPAKPGAGFVRGFCRIEAQGGERNLPLPFFCLLDRIRERFAAAIASADVPGPMTIRGSRGLAAGTCLPVAVLEECLAGTALFRGGRQLGLADRFIVVGIERSERLFGVPQFVHCQDAVPVEIEVAEETGVDFAAFRANGQSQRRPKLLIDERSKFLLRDLAVGRVDVDVFPTRLRSASACSARAVKNGPSSFFSSVPS